MIVTFLLLILVELLIITVETVFSSHLIFIKRFSEDIKTVFKTILSVG